jgi:hypothetical protein
MIVDYLGLKDAWLAYKAGKPFEAIRILAATDMGVLEVSPDQAKEFARMHPREVWLQPIEEHAFQILLGELHPLWIHIVLSGYEAGEGVEQEMYLLPESDAPGFNSKKIRLLVNDWIRELED